MYIERLGARSLVIWGNNIYILLTSPNEHLITHYPGSFCASLLGLQKVCICYFNWRRGGYKNRLWIYSKCLGEQEKITFTRLWCWFGCVGALRWEGAGRVALGWEGSFGPFQHQNQTPPPLRGWDRFYDIFDIWRYIRYLWYLDWGLGGERAATFVEVVMSKVR